jgi:NAD(P)-dependent dehydrogenase (short-subunit alcohol dehydrogenase family)
MTKTYLISGAGSGIGKAIAQQLSAEGHNCILLGRNADNLHQTLQSLSNSGHIVLTADIKDKKSLSNAVAKLGGITIDGLIANSGIGGENYWGDDDRWHDIIETNLTGTYNFVNTFLPYLSKGYSEKHILITSSILSLINFRTYI